jgi:hypothetical protein
VLEDFSLRLGRCDGVRCMDGESKGSGTRMKHRHCCLATSQFLWDLANSYVFRYGRYHEQKLDECRAMQRSQSIFCIILVRSWKRSPSCLPCTLALASLDARGIHHTDYLIAHPNSSLTIYYHKPPTSKINNSSTILYTVRRRQSCSPPPHRGARHSSRSHVPPMQCSKTIA